MFYIGIVTWLIIVLAKQWKIVLVVLGVIYLVELTGTKEPLINFGKEAYKRTSTKIEAQVKDWKEQKTFDVKGKTFPETSIKQVEAQNNPPEEKNRRKECTQ